MTIQDLVFRLRRESGGYYKQGMMEKVVDVVSRKYQVKNNFIESKI